MRTVRSHGLPGIHEDGAVETGVAFVDVIVETASPDDRQRPRVARLPGRQETNAIQRETIRVHVERVGLNVVDRDVTIDEGDPGSLKDA